VTLDGKPVAGEISFVGTSGEAKAPLLDGNYTVTNPPKGECNIVIQSLTMGGGPAIKPPPGMEKAGGGTGTLSGTGAGGVPPPAKYGQPNNGLKFTVTGGKQTYDIQLTP